MQRATAVHENPEPSIPNSKPGPPALLAHNYTSRSLCLILVLLLLSVWVAGVAVDDGHEFIYDGFAGNTLSMGGDSSVVDGLLRLTAGNIA